MLQQRLAKIPLETAVQLLQIIWPTISISTLRQDAEDGAPVHTDGTVDLLHYIAWRFREHEREKAAGQAGYPMRILQHASARLQDET